MLAEQEEEPTIDSNRDVCRPRRKRKFPGPAGLLPDLDDKDVEVLNSSRNPLTKQVSVILTGDRNNRERSPIHSQSSQEKYSAVLNLGPRDELVKQLNLDEHDEHCISNLVNINWIQTTAIHLPRGTKIPFLLAVLQEAPELPTRTQGQKKTPCVKLVDSSGTIEAAVESAFVANYGKELIPGTAIAVWNAGILHFKRNLTIAITCKNVVCLASYIGTGTEFDKKRKETSSSHTLPSFVSEGIKITCFSEFSVEKALQSYNQLCDPKVLRQRSVVNERNNMPITRRRSALFSSVQIHSRQEADFVFGDDDDDLFLAFDMEAAENEYLSQPQPARSVSVSTSTQDESRNTIVGHIDRETSDVYEKNSDLDPFDKELAAFDDIRCHNFESSHVTQQTQNDNLSENLPDNKIQTEPCTKVGHGSSVMCTNHMASTITTEHDIDDAFFDEFEKEIDAF